nr:type VI secretion system baseplate subunit TssG [Limnobacter humi]
MPTANFYAALRALEEANPTAAPWGDSLRLREDAARLGQGPFLGFATQDLQAVAHPSTANGLHHFHVQVSNFGLLGPQGALPLHWTELAYQRAHHHKDLAFIHFLDVFHHRLFSLFYKAWAQALPHIGLHRAQPNTFEWALHSLLGLSPRSQEASEALPNHFYPGLASHMARPQPSAERLRKGLSALWGCPVQVIDPVGRWLPAPGLLQGCPSDPTHRRLGGGALLGRRCWDPQAAVRVVLGPLPWDCFAALSRGGRHHACLQHAVGGLLGPDWQTDTALLPDVAQIPPLRLGRDQSQALGRTAFLGRPTRMPSRPVPLSFMSKPITLEGS